MAARYFVGDSSATINTFVAIDFGTTYSAFCFAAGKESAEYNVQPDAGGRKIPTSLLLRPDTSLDSFGEHVLGKYTDMEDDEREGWYLFDRFKMSLKDDKAVRGDMPIKASGKGDKSLPAKVVFSRSLEYFYKLAKEEISKCCGSWHDDEVKWVLTVPAIWGDRARQFMKEAAFEAGMAGPLNPDGFEIALEPEGAALACRDKLMHVWRNFGQPPVLRYAVVDCGGGTIDITVHDLEMSSSNVKEVHRASGGAWGGSYVDQNIKKLVQRILGHKVSRKLTDDDWLRFTRQSIEKAKQSIVDDTDQVFFDVPNEMHMAISECGSTLEEAAKSVSGVKARRGRLSLDVKLVEDCFKESLDNISQHVHELVRVVTGIRCILVVGGFAESPFLIKRMESDFSSAECRVARPRDASIAVVKGAAMYGQNPDVITARISKYTYGVEARSSFNEKKHPKSKRVEEDDGPYCTDVFDKFILINDSVECGKPIKRSYLPSCPNQTEVPFGIYRSTKRDAMFTDDPSCEHLLTVTVHSPNVERGTDRKLLVEMDFSSTLLHFEAVDASSGKSAQADIQFDTK